MVGAVSLTLSGCFLFPKSATPENLLKSLERGCIIYGQTSSGEWKPNDESSELSDILSETEFEELAYFSRTGPGLQEYDDRCILNFASIGLEYSLWIIDDNQTVKIVDDAPLSRERGYYSIDSSVHRAVIEYGYRLLGLNEDGTPFDGDPEKNSSIVTINNRN